MRKMQIKFIAAVTTALISHVAIAQTVERAPLDEPAAVTDEAASSDPVADQAASGEAPADEVIVEPDNMADFLNSQQQVKQSFTLKRRINGAVVESEKRTVVFDRDKPRLATEAGQSTVEQLRSEFDGELLTRKEAFEEAKIDFTVADVNHDDQMSADEFAALVAGWRDAAARHAPAPTEEIARQREYDAFLAEISDDAAELQTEAYAREKFSFMSGAAEFITKQDYIREYLLDFDSMDANQDMLLNGDELMRFRALNRGETLEM